MNKFKAMKKNKVDEKKLDNFVKGADNHDVVIQSKKPWEKFDPNEKAAKGFSVQINDYDLEILRFLKEHEDRSQRKIAQRLLSKTLREEINTIK